MTDDPDLDPDRSRDRLRVRSDRALTLGRDAAGRLVLSTVADAAESVVIEHIEAVLA